MKLAWSGCYNRLAVNDYNSIAIKLDYCFSSAQGSNVRLTLKSVYATIVLTQYSDNYYYLVKQHLPVEEMFICEKR